MRELKMPLHGYAALSLLKELAWDIEKMFLFIKCFLQSLK